MKEGLAKLVRLTQIAEAACVLLCGVACEATLDANIELELSCHANRYNDGFLSPWLEGL